MTRFYPRTTRLTVWRPRPSPTSALGAFFEAVQPNAVQVDGLRIQFTINKSLGSAPNTAEVIVTNLAEATRAEFEERPRKVMLEVGFDGVLQHLFSGDVLWAQSTRSGADWETQLQIRDGGRAHSAARVNRSYDRGVAVLTVLRDVASSMGLDLPRDVERRPDLQRQFAAGAAVLGRAADEMSRLLEPFGLGWSIQDGTLQILDEGGARPGQAIVIDESAGMIESPTFSPPSKSSRRPVLHVAALLYPQITPGGTIEVRAAKVRGQFKVVKVSHTGDSHGEARTEIEATAR